MKYLVHTGDGYYAADPKARELVNRLDRAHRYDKANDANHTARMLRHRYPGAVAVGEATHLEDLAIDAEV